MLFSNFQARVQPHITIIIWRSNVILGLYVNQYQYKYSCLILCMRNCHMSYSLLNMYGKLPYIKIKVNCVFTFHINAVKAPTVCCTVECSSKFWLFVTRNVHCYPQLQLFLVNVNCSPQFMLLLAFQSQVQSHITIHEEQTFNLGFVCKPIPIKIFIAKYLCMGNRHTSKVKWNAFPPST